MNNRAKHLHGPTDNLSQVLGIINNMALRAAGGKFIFRGEPKHYDKVVIKRSTGNMGKAHPEVKRLQSKSLNKKFWRQTYRPERNTEGRPYTKLKS